MAAMQPPGAMTMTKEELLGPAPGMVIKQLTNECCRCFTCQPNIHWTVHDYADNYDPNMPEAPATMWVQENAGYCGRVWSCCSPGCRPTQYKVLQGAPPVGMDPDSATGHLLMTHEKGCTCGQNVIIMFSDQGPIRMPMCCFLPYLDTKDAQGNLLATTNYLCDECLCVPKFSVTRPTGDEMYRIRPDTCFMGMCVECKCDGAKGKCCRVPFYIRKPDPSMEKLDAGEAVIVDLWAGFKNECCTRRNVYQIRFPKGAGVNEKAALMGSTLLVDLVLYEQEGS